MAESHADRVSELAQKLRDDERRSLHGLADSDAPVIVLGGDIAKSQSDERAERAQSAESRRTFLARSSVLTLAIPGLGAALAACSPSDRSTASTGGSAVPDSARPAAAPGTHNSDSRLDSAVLKSEHHGASAAAGAARDASNVGYHRWTPELPPHPGTTTQRIHFHAREAPVCIDESTVVAAWTFDGDVPGPIVHTRIGDTVEFTLTNDAAVPHSMDFHAAQLDPKEAFKSVLKGASHTFKFKPRYAGAFLYHCGTAPVLMHLGSGMFGAICVSPREGLAPARDFVLVQNEYYLADAANGARASDYQKMLTTLPDIVCFNGRPNQYVNDPIHVKVGDRVRFWVVSAGPSHPCNFHIVGEQFDTVYLGSPPANAIKGVQTFGVSPGGGMIFELVCDVAGEFPFVNHGFGHGQKGAIGLLIVE